MNASLHRTWQRGLPWAAVVAVLLFCVSPSLTQPKAADKAPDKAPDRPADAPTSSYDQITPVLLGQQTFEAMMAKDKADKDAVMARQKKLLRSATT